MARASSNQILIGFIVFFLIILGGAGFLIYKQYKKKIILEAKIATLQTKRTGLQQLLEEKDKAKIATRLANAMKMMGKFKKILPNLKAEEGENLLTAFSKIRMNTGMWSDSFKMLDATKKDEIADVKRVTYQTVLFGRFGQFISFLHKLENMEKFIKVEKFTVRNIAGKKFKFLGGSEKEVSERVLQEIKKMKKISLTFSSYYYAPKEEVVAPVAPK